jgi:integrase
MARNPSSQPEHGALLGRRLHLKWEHFNLTAGTYSGKREKKGFRIGWLWKETVDAVKALPRKGESPLLFTSQRGAKVQCQFDYDTDASCAGVRGFQYRSRLSGMAA